MKTPNLDKLAKEGLLFDFAVSASSCSAQGCCALQLRARAAAQPRAQHGLDLCARPEPPREQRAAQRARRSECRPT